MNRELEEKIRNELNIDISSYRNDEAVEQITDIILFPKYALQWILIPFILSIGIFIAGFWVFSISAAGYIFYCTIGLFLFGVVGLLAGLYYFSLQLQDDVDGIMNYSIHVTQLGMEDLKKMGTKLSVQEKGNAAKLLFLGVTQLVTVPSVSAAIKKKIPVLGPLLAIIVSRIMMALSSKMELSAEQKATETDDKKLSHNKLLDDDEVEIKPATSSKVLSKALRIIRLPIRLFLIVFTILLVIFMLLIT